MTPSSRWRRSPGEGVLAFPPCRRGRVPPQNQLPAARRAFDAFFARYPYCYGYWKKYADMERRFGCARQAEEVPGGALPPSPHTALGGGGVGWLG